MPRDDHRALQQSRTARIVDGNDHSCGQDALINGAMALGVPVSKKEVYADTLPPEGDTQVGVLVDYARETLKILEQHHKDAIENEKGPTQRASEVRDVAKRTRMTSRKMSSTARMACHS